MKEIYLSGIQIEKVRNVAKLDIDLSSSERVHLLLTGRNGSGKTVLLQEINKFLVQVVSGNHGRLKTFEDAYRSLQDQHRQIESSNELVEFSAESEERDTKLADIESNLKRYEARLEPFGGVRLSFVDDRIISKEEVDEQLIVAFFEARRMISLAIPDGVKKVDLNRNYAPTPQISDQFLQYIVNLKADRSFARDDGESEVVQQIDDWFVSFQSWLRELIGDPALELRFDRKNYSFLIFEKNKIPYGLDKLADGYSAILNVITEILLRMEAHDVRSYDMQGIVLIDELETHLHVELQKQILPFLIKVFPQVQFIVSTHSPFVLQSVENTVVCDLEHRMITKELSGYSYDALIESFFFSDKYSNVVKSKVDRYEELVAENELDDDGMEELRYLKGYFAQVPKYLSDELHVKLQQILLKEMERKAEKQ